MKKLEKEQVETREREDTVDTRARGYHEAEGDKVTGILARVGNIVHGSGYGETYLKQSSNERYKM